VGLDPRIFVRQIGAESGFRTGARSGAGARGIAQIMPFHDVQPGRPGHQVAGQNPEVDLRWAAQHMATTLKKYGNYRDALSVYNSGQPWSKSAPGTKPGKNIEETRNYVAKILNGADPATNANPAVRHVQGGNSFSGGAGARPKALANFLLNQSMALAAGQPFDLGAMSQAMQADRQESANQLHGLDPGGEDSADPRVRTEPTVPLRGGGAAQSMKQMIAQAKRMGLHVGGNHAATGRPETSGHTAGSDHYRYLAPGVQGAIDVSGDPKQEVAFFRWIERNRGRLGLKDLFHDPMGYSYDEGNRWGKTIGGHGHVHASVRPRRR
jgi:hypothetical protein